MTELTTGIPVTVRFFAAARAAAGLDSSVLTLPAGTSIEDLARILCDQSDEMALVIPRCSYLIDGVAVRDRGTALRPNQTLDVLPPFAGG